MALSSKSELGKIIFEIRGLLPPDEKVGFLKKWPYQFIAYENGMFIKCGEDQDYILLKDVQNVYVNYAITDDGIERNLKVQYYENGEPDYTYAMSEVTFPNLIENIENIYKNEWENYAIKYPDSIKWFTAVISNWLIFAERPYNVFGLLEYNKLDIEFNREVLKDTWGIVNKSGLIAMCERMINCPTLDSAKAYYRINDPSETYIDIDEDEYEYDEEVDDETYLRNMPHELLKIREPILADFDRAIKAFDLYRVIVLAYFGCTTKFFEFDEAMDWCLKAGLEIQKLYSSWDDFHENYMLGYCYWAEEDADLEYSDANNRKKIYNIGKEFKTNPWQIDWNTKLTKEW